MLHAARQAEVRLRSPVPRAMAVEIVSAELAQDGGPAPDVRCTIAQRSGGNVSPRVASTSVCRQSWSPVWKETLRLELEAGDKDTWFFDLVLWDDSGADSEQTCLGEMVCGLHPPGLLSFLRHALFAFPLCSDTLTQQTSLAGDTNRRLADPREGPSPGAEHAPPTGYG